MLHTLQVFPSTGSLVFMFGKMLLDCSTWSAIFTIGLLAFSSSMKTLYHNKRAAIEQPLERLDSDCQKMDSALDGVPMTALFLLQVTLGADPAFDCFHNTSAKGPGVFLMMTFMGFVVIILLNMLIAMMADTYAQKAEKSFANYALGFAHELAKRRQRYYTGSSPPLNLLEIPYQLFRLLRALFCALVCRRNPGNSPKHTAASRKLEAESTSSSQPSDAEVSKLIDAVRIEIIRSKKDHLQKTVARFCRAQEEADEGPTIDDIKDIVREENTMLRNFLTGDGDGRGGGNGGSKAKEGTEVHSALKASALHIDENARMLEAIKELSLSTQASVAEMRGEMRASIAQLRDELGEVSSRISK